MQCQRLAQRAAVRVTATATATANVPKKRAMAYVSFRENKPLIIAGMGNFYYSDCRHSIGLRTVDELVRNHLGWTWSWNAGIRGWVSEGTIDVPIRLASRNNNSGSGTDLASLSFDGRTAFGENDRNNNSDLVDSSTSSVVVGVGDDAAPLRANKVKVESKHVVFVKPGTYNIRTNGIAARRACTKYRVRPENCLNVHFDPSQPVGFYGPAYTRILPSGVDAEVRSVPFLLSLARCLKIRNEQMAPMLRRFVLGCDAPDGDEDRLAFNLAIMKRVEQKTLNEAYLNTKFTPRQEQMWREYVLGNADHLLRSMIASLESPPPEIPEPVQTMTDSFF